MSSSGVQRWRLVGRPFNEVLGELSLMSLTVLPVWSADMLLLLSFLLCKLGWRKKKKTGPCWGYRCMNQWVATKKWLLFMNLGPVVFVSNREVKRLAYVLLEVHKSHCTVGSEFNWGWGFTFELNSPSRGALIFTKSVQFWSFSPSISTVPLPIETKTHWFIGDTMTGPISCRWSVTDEQTKSSKIHQPRPPSQKNKTTYCQVESNPLFIRWHPDDGLQNTGRWHQEDEGHQHDGSRNTNQRSDTTRGICTVYNIFLLLLCLLCTHI